MTHVLHDLHAEFPADGEILHALKLSDAHFQRLAVTYGELNQEVQRIEAGLEPAADSRLEGLKKQRLAVLDDLSAIVASKRG